MLHHARATVALVPLLLVLALGAASPAGANFVAAGADPAGDATDPSPGRDIVAVGLGYDRRSGHLRGGIKLAGSPVEAPATLTLFAGPRTATGCGYPAIGFRTQTDERSADWVRLDAPGAPPAAMDGAMKLYDDVAEEYEATASALAGLRPACVLAELSEPGNPAVVYDTAGPLELRGLPELQASLGKLPSIMRPNRSRTVRLTLRNPGDGPTGRVRLTVSNARGMKVVAPRTVRSLRPGARRAVALKVTLGGRARSTTG